MATTKVEICNSALIKVGAESISSLTSGSREADIMNTLYDQIRREMLRSHPWNFAIARTQLGASSGTPEFEFTKMFVIPSDVLRVLKIDSKGEPYKIEYDPVNQNRVILTNASTLEIQYIRDVEDVTQFDANFTEAFACRLAAESAYAFTNSNNLAAQMFTLYQQALANARSFDAQEGTPDAIEADDWFNWRL